jgi:hypothetical protein
MHQKKRKPFEQKVFMAMQAFLKVFPPRPKALE